MPLSRSLVIVLLLKQKAPPQRATPTAEVFVDGAHGILWVDPHEEDVAGFAADARDYARHLSEATASSHLITKPIQPRVCAGCAFLPRAAGPCSIKMADFASIGTNDLTQFMLAADRNTLDVISQDAVLHPAMLRAIKLVTDAGVAARKPVSVCGEAAADPAVARVLVGLGVRHLSMNAAASARVRRCIRALEVREAEALASQALACAHHC